MNVTYLTITEQKGIILFGNCLVNFTNVEFAYNSKLDKFTAIVYNKYQADGKLPEVNNRNFLVGRAISKVINSL